MIGTLVAHGVRHSRLGGPVPFHSGLSGIPWRRGAVVVHRGRRTHLFLPGRPGRYTCEAPVSLIAKLHRGGPTPHDFTPSDMVVRGACRVGHAVSSLSRLTGHGSGDVIGG